jgi:N-formylglutamate deformylase
MQALRAVEAPPFEVEVRDPDVPLFAVALHHGHDVRPEVSSLLAIDDATRKREEDPMTGAWTYIAPNRIIARRSRFEVDLNRPPDKAIYTTRDVAWGLDVWRAPPPRAIVDRSLAIHAEVYRSARDVLDTLTHRHRRVLVLDLHSYNHRRTGGPEDPAKCPELNVGTGSLDRTFWGPVVDAFMTGARRARCGVEVDVRENVRFRGAYFAAWVHAHYPHRACVLALEVKKTFMDEWSGEVDEARLVGWREILKAGATSALGAL